MDAKLMNARRLAIMLATAIALTATATARADVKQTKKHSMIEVAGGYEAQVLDFTVPANNDPNAQTQGSDRSRGGARLALTFKGLELEQLMSDSGATRRFAFLPIQVVLDASNFDEGSGFGRIQGIDTGASMIRKAVGVLVEAGYEPKDNLYQFRGKIAQVEYDRDKGVWDWKALDATVAMVQKIDLDGSTKLELEVSMGVGAGGVILKGLEDVQNALGATSPSDSAFTINPHALLRAGIVNKDKYRVELSGEFEQRFDLTLDSQKSTYLGNTIDSSSQRIRAGIDAEYVLKAGRDGSSLSDRLSLSLFGSATYEYDNLTLSNIFFGTGDAFQSFQFMAGVRGRI